MAEYLKSVEPEWYRQRLVRATFCVAAAFAILFVRLFYLQVIKGKELRRLSENNCIRLQTTDPSRGLIYDRNGTLLVDNRPSFDLSIILKDAKPLKSTINNLSQYMHIPVSKLMMTINRNKSRFSYKPVLLKRDIGRDMLAMVEVRKFDLPGVVVNVKPRRHYIFKNSAAHLIGYLSKISLKELRSGKYEGYNGDDYIGKFGVEKTFDSFLRGKHGGRQVEVNATGRVMEILKTVDAVPGDNIYLTIDQVLQNRVEDLMQGLAGAAIAMDPDTGEILAMASAPAFDQNMFVNGMSHKRWGSLVSNPLRPLENKAIQGEYPPASTFKIVTAIAGLEEGVIDEKTVLHCPGYYKYGDRTFKCWRKKGHGNVDIFKALTESCDVFFYQVGQKLGVDVIARYARACGLGSATGIHLYQEATGLVPTSGWKKRRTGIPWQRGETLSVAIGQGYDLVTPLQMLIITAAVANGGTRYMPRILKGIKTSEGGIVIKGKPKIIGKLPVSEHTLAIIRKSLWQVVNSAKGTGRIARIRGADISGKTGTAQLFGNKDDDDKSDKVVPENLKDHAWFVAYAPSGNPKIAVTVLVEHGEHGSSSAAPIAREIIKTYLAKKLKGKSSNLRAQSSMTNEE